MTEDLESECRKAREKSQDVCVWTKRHTGDFKTQCGKDYICDYNCMCPKEDSFDFCLFRGKEIHVEKETT